jgi:hypothetical protein
MWRVCGPLDYRELDLVSKGAQDRLIADCKLPAHGRIGGPGFHEVASAYESTMQFDDYAELREVNPL